MKFRELHNVLIFARLFLVTLLFTLPWAIWLKIGGQNLNFNLEIIKQNLHWHYIYIHKYIFPLFLLIPVLLSMLRKSFRVPMKSGRGNLIYFRLPRLRQLADPRNEKNNYDSISLLLLFSIIIISNLGLYTFNHPYFFRYLIPLIPFFAYIAAQIIVNLPKRLAIVAVFIAFYRALNFFLVIYLKLLIRMLGLTNK